jgi:hypothetical protein
MSRLPKHLQLPYESVKDLNDSADYRLLRGLAPVFLATGMPEKQQRVHI